MTRLKAFIKQIFEAVFSIPSVDKLRNDFHFRRRISLYISFLMNLMYIAVKLISGIYYSSVWFISIAFYYIILAFMRYLLLRRERREISRDRSEWRKYRFCGIVLLFMNQALVGIVVFIVNQNQSYEYPGIIIYAMAAYSFYIIISAIVNLAKYRKQNNPIISAMNIITFVASMVSMLSLETALMAQFGDGDSIFRRTMTAITGGAVCVIVLGLAVYMIVRSSKKLKAFHTNSKSNH